VSINKQSSLAHKSGSRLPLEAKFSESKVKKKVAEEGTTKVDDKENVVPCVTYLPVNRLGSVTLTFACVCVICYFFGVWSVIFV
jgi:quinol-cytochrome oxidoreductase complex cytochrome b subunit